MTGTDSAPAARETERPKNRLRRSLLFYVPTVAIALWGTAQAFLVGPSQRGTHVGPALLLLNIVAFGCALPVSRRRRYGRSLARAWKCIALSCFTLLLSQVAFIALSDRLLGGLLRFVSALIMMTGLLWLPRRASGSRERYKLVLDVTTVILAGTMALWCFTVGPMLAGGNPGFWHVFRAVALPLSDLMLLFGLAVALTRGVDSAARRPLSLLSIAFLAEICGNLGLAFDGNSQYTPAIWQWLSWIIGHLLIACATFEQSGRRSRLRHEHDYSRGASMLPYAAAVFGVALTVTSTLTDVDHTTLTGLVLGMAAITIAVLTRQMFAIRENRQRAITDGLTGLANRSHFYDSLALALARGKRNQKLVGLLACDLNLFKEINDTYGHAAGDLVLTEFSRMLRHAVLGRDVVGRLGGDEFAVLLLDIKSREDAEAVIRRIRAEMDTPILVGDTPITIRASIGLAMSDPDANDPDALLEVADEGMYMDKRRSRETADLTVAPLIRRP